MIQFQEALGIRSSALECLEELQGVKIHEKASGFEALTAFLGTEIEMANKYKIYAPGGWDDLFYAVEKTSFINRNVQRCFGACTGWHVDLYYSQGIGSEKSFHVNRPNSMTCCCINRPEAHLTDSEGTLIGTVQEPFLCCCDMGFNINDEFEETQLRMQSTTCQAGYMCPLPCPCLDCNDVEFDILDANTGDKVGDMKKKVPSLWMFFAAPDVDNYILNWDGVTDPKLKALLLVTALYIDFRHFNANANAQAPRQTMMGTLGERFIEG